MMILRTRPGLGVKKPVMLAFPGRKEPVSVETYACNPGVCIALLPVGPILREQIAKALSWVSPTKPRQRKRCLSTFP